MKKKIIIFFVCFSIFYRVFTPISYYYSSGRAFSMLVPTLLLYVLGTLYKSLHFNLAILVSIIPLLLGYMGVEYFEGYLPESVSLLFAIGCIEYYLRTKDDSFAKYALSTIYISLFALALISLPILIAEPGLNRTVNEMQAEGFEVPRIAYFTISYGSVHAVPILVVPLFFLYKRVRSCLVRLFVIIFLVALYVTTILSNAATPMFMLFIYILFLVLNNPKKSNSSNIAKIVGTLMVILFLFGSGALNLFLGSVQSLLGGTMQERRIDEVTHYIDTGTTTGDMSAREDRYMISVNSFLSHPLSWEENINHIGKHSHLIDHLAAMGIICFLPFAFLLVYQYKKPLKQIGKGKAYYLMAYSAFILLAGLKNFFPAESAMFVCPALIIYINRHFPDESLLHK